MSEQHEKTTRVRAELYETTMPLLEAMYSEFQDHAKKKADSAVSKSKVRIVNRLLDDIRKVLLEEKSIGYLDRLEEDDVPQASDVTLVLSQYVAAMKAFRAKYYGWDGTDHRWFTSR